MQILFNANVYTQNNENPRATALAIQADHIFAVGTDAEMLALVGPNSQTLDLHGKTIWPGLTDAHLHMEYYAGFLQMIDCETSTKQECLRRVGERAQQTPAGAWVTGHGWNQNVWEGGFGNAADLDQVSMNHPVFLTSKSIHSAWANSLALQMAGISASTPDPQGGSIGRDQNGQPNGILFESAMGLVSQGMPPPSTAQLVDWIDQAQQALWKMGITGVHDYDRRSCFLALQTLVEQDRLHLRTVKGVPLELLPHAAALGLRSGFGGDFLRIGSVKLFADGALGPRTAAMLQPYEGESENTGLLLLDAEQILEYGQQAVTTGLSLAIHAIGDRANHEVLNAYEQLRLFERDNHLPHYRHRIEHVQLLHPDDIERLARLNVVASMQPIHATSDLVIADQHWGKRSIGAYAWRSLLNHHTAVAFGSDAPVESPNPFWGLHAAVTRQRANGDPGPEGWYPAQRLTLSEALDGYTTGPAYAAGLENQLGKLAPGHYADLIVLADDPFQHPAADLVAIMPESTMVGGQWVWQS